MFNKNYLFIAVCLITLLVGSIGVIAHGYETVERSLVRDSLETLREHTDFMQELRECTIEHSYFHWSKGVEESNYFKLPGLYVVIDQECDWGSKSMYVDVLSDFPQFERLDRVPFYPAMS